MATVEAPTLTALPQDEAAARAESVPDWTLREGTIEREFKLRNFREAMAFINQVAEAAEQMLSKNGFTIVGLGPVPDHVDFGGFSGSLRRKGRPP